MVTEPVEVTIKIMSIMSIMSKFLPISLFIVYASPAQLHQ
jgi:hypothetical protein